MDAAGNQHDNLRALIRKQEAAIVKAKARLEEFERTMARYGLTETTVFPGSKDKQTNAVDLKALLKRQEAALARANARLAEIRRIVAEAGLYQSLN
jgi:hypothetical protein